jgi:tRNA modification GTPase
MNALLGENRVIVSDIPGTTRDSIEEMLEIKGWPVRLLDTAGLRDTSDTIEAEGVERSEKLISQADIVLVLSEDENGFELASNFDSTNVICVQTKIDLHSGDVNTYEGIKISSVSGEGLESLKNHIAEKLEVLSSKEEESSGADVTTRQVECLGEAFNAFTNALNALEIPEYVIAANETANGVRAIGRLLGKVYSEDLLDALFSRFCIGK